MTYLASLRLLWAALLRAVMKLTSGISWLSARVIGKWKWQPPSWAPWIGRRIAQGGHYVAADSRRAAVFVLVLMGAVGGLVWYRNRPVPHYVAYSVTGPGLTEYGDKGISSIKPLIVQFSESAAPLQQVDKTI